jgi:hypothetical protein
VCAVLIDGSLHICSTVFRYAKINLNLIAAREKRLRERQEEVKMRQRKGRFEPVPIEWIPKEEFDAKRLFQVCLASNRFPPFFFFSENISKIILSV